MPTSLQQLIAQAKDNYHTSSKKLSQLGDAATDEHRQELETAQAELLDLMNREREAEAGTEGLDELENKYKERQTRDATRKFHQAAQHELEKALQKNTATDQAVGYFDSSQFVPDPTDASRPLFRTKSGNLVSIAEGVASELPSSLRRGAAADLDELRMKLKETKERYTLAKQQFHCNRHHDSSHLFTMTKANSEAKKIQKKIDELTAPPDTTKPKDVAADLAAARAEMTRAQQDVRAHRASQNSLLAYSRAKRKVKVLEKKLEGMKTS